MTESHHPFSTQRPAPSARGQLLATLLSQNTLVQPEVALTRATQFLLGLRGAAHALDMLVERAGLVPEPGGYWLTEVRGAEGGRTDLEYRWGSDEAVQVIVEAKVGHFLGSGQVDAYRPRLGHDGLLVVLVPATRRIEGRRVVEYLNKQYEATGDRVRVALWTWDQVASELELALPEHQYPDVIQLRGLIEAAGALDIRPFAESELITSDRSRFDDLWSVLDKASFRGFPFQSGPGRYFERYRLYPVGAFGAEFFVGLGRTGQSEPEPWCWVRVSGGERHGAAQQEALRAHRPDAKQDGNSLIVPLSLEPGLSGYELIESLSGQLEEIALQIREGLRTRFAAFQHIDVPAQEEVLSPLVAIRAFTAAELLDSNSSRREDIQKVLDQVSRHIFHGKKGGWTRVPDVAFQRRNWITIDPHAIHLSIGVARMDTSMAPRPWAWLSIEGAAANSDAAHRALEEAFPDEVVPIPKGWGLPLRISPGQNGVEAFASVFEQIDQAKTVIRRALEDHS